VEVEGERSQGVKIQKHLPRLREVLARLVSYVQGRPERVVYWLAAASLVLPSCSREDQASLDQATSRRIVCRICFQCH
jgi:hypothetical protein